MDDLGPLFQPPSDPDRFWILVVLLVAPAIASCLYVLAFALIQRTGEHHI